VPRRDADGNPGGDRALKSASPAALRTLGFHNARARGTGVRRPVASRRGECFKIFALAQTVDGGLVGHAACVVIARRRLARVPKGQPPAKGRRPASDCSHLDLVARGPHSEAGRSTAGLGDIDSETRDDVAIGAPGHPYGGFTGMVLAFRGVMWGPTAAPMWSRGATLGDRFGELVLGVDHVVSGISPYLLVGTPTATGQFTDEGIEVVTDGPLPDDTRIDLFYDVE
jgi:hypothetical protein